MTNIISGSSLPIEPPKRFPKPNYPAPIHVVEAAIKASIEAQNINKPIENKVPPPLPPKPAALSGLTQVQPSLSKSSGKPTQPPPLPPKPKSLLSQTEFPSTSSSSISSLKPKNSPPPLPPKPTLLPSEITKPKPPELEPQPHLNLSQTSKQSLEAPTQMAPKPPKEDTPVTEKLDKTLSNETNEHTRPVLIKLKSLLDIKNIVNQEDLNIEEIKKLSTSVPEIEESLNNLEETLNPVKIHRADSLREAKSELLKATNEALGLKESQDLGGHGGTRLATIKHEGKDHRLFLKGHDNIEALNYKIIKNISPELAECMPTIYGDVEVEGKHFLAMENTRPEGSEQLGDLKMAGEGGTIVRDAEIQTTRDTKKNVFDKWQMKLGARSSPGYMFAVASKFTRIFNYWRSKTLFIDSIKDSFKKTNTPDSQVRASVNDLIQQLEKLKNAQQQSDIAFIGGSIMITREGDKIIPRFIDPAHTIINPEKKENLRRILNDDVDTAYFGKTKDDSTEAENLAAQKKEFETQRNANIDSINRMIVDLKTEFLSGFAQQILLQTQTPKKTESPPLESYKIIEMKGASDDSNEDEVDPNAPPIPPRE